MLWRGFAQSDGTWEPLSSLNEHTLADDIIPLLQRLRDEGAKELQQHHTCTLKQVHCGMQRALRFREGDGALDRGIQMLLRIESLTFKRLFGERLDLLARTCRSGRPSCRSYSFSNTSQFYYTVFPKMRLQQLGSFDGSVR
eukprot:COSAG02_NODE_31090_length_539_cov_1.072727_1_plen_140_part_10